MNCTKFETAAQQLLDERTVALPAEMTEHLAACGDCRSFWNGQLWLLKANQSFAVAELPAGMLAATLQQMKAADSSDASRLLTRRQNRPVRWGWAAAVSCAAALALIAVSLPPHAVPPGDSQTLADRDVAVEESESLLASQSLSRLWNGVQAEYQELSKDTTDTLSEMGDLPDTAAILPVVSPWAPALADPPESWQRVDRPISERVEAAFDFLWDALPSTAPQSL